MRLRFFQRLRAAAVLSASCLLFTCACAGGAQPPLPPRAAVALRVLPRETAIDLGTAQVFSATATYDDGTQADVSDRAVWSAGSGAAEVGTTGFVQSKTEGVAIISARLGMLEAAATLTVFPAALRAIVVSPADASVPAGLSQQFTAAGIFTDGSSRTVAVGWESSDPAIATIDALGAAQARTRGAVRIVAAARGLAGSRQLTVTGALARSLSISPAQATIPTLVLEPFAASATYSDGVVRDVSAQAVWRSSDPLVLHASPAGATGVSAGQAAISATFGAPSAQARVTVTELAAVTLAASPWYVHLAAGQAQQVAALATAPDGRTADVSSVAVWATSDARVAKVSSAGVVASVGPGTADISVSLGAQTARTRVVSGGCARTELPKHLGLGLGSQPLQLRWMVDSGIPWDYRYQYLGGGVNTGWSWQTWASPPGQFAIDYAAASGQDCYLPIFSYYQLVNSNPNPNIEVPGPKLQSAATMNAYFTDFRFLMQTLGALPGIAIVQVEPDLWGFMQAANGDDPAQTQVMVAGSGFADAAGLPDDARGFAQALVHLRDLYAPRVKLAWHASSWATGTDVVLQQGDPVAIGTRTAAFYNALGVTFDLLFYDPSDHDADWYRLVKNVDRRWNDASYDLYRQFIATMTAATGLKAMLWQVPLGNSLYRSCNQTNDHYQDNHVQYFLGAAGPAHLAQYAAAGLIGILFGRGNDGSSSYDDAAGDGITNPDPVDGNTLVATVPDDDGGLLRNAATAYYRAEPVALP